MKMTPTQDVKVSYGLFEESNTVWREDAGSLFSCKWRLVFYVMQMVEVLWASVGCAVLNVHAKFKCLYPLYTIYIHYTYFLIRKDIRKDWFVCGFVYLPRIGLSVWSGRSGRSGRYGSFSSCYDICSCIRKYIHIFDCQSECVGLVSDKVMG